MLLRCYRATTFLCIPPLLSPTVSRSLHLTISHSLYLAISCYISLYLAISRYISLYLAISRYISQPISRYISQLISVSDYTRSRYLIEALPDCLPNDGDNNVLDSRLDVSYNFPRGPCLALAFTAKVVL